MASHNGCGAAAVTLKQQESGQHGSCSEVQTSSTYTIKATHDVDLHMMHLFDLI